MGFAVGFTVVGIRVGAVVVLTGVKTVVRHYLFSLIEVLTNMDVIGCKNKKNTNTHKLKRIY